MCGIAGYYSFDNSLSKVELKQMTDAIKHRGPNADGFFIEDQVGLGHRRLSIIDLREIANQPMTSFNNRYVIIFNGEVYNFKELSNQVRVNNDDFYYKTNSDTEVILEAFAKWGVDFVNRLNGMFAIAIYDKVDKHLFLYRDRIGIKPIFYYWDGSNFMFASELKSLTAIASIKSNLTINQEAIQHYLHLGYIPAPLTIYNEIKKFPAGHKLHINKDIFNLEPYWKLEEKVDFDTFNNYSEAKKKLKYLVETSVKYRMISDVPFGTFLSGGIDSSLVSAVAQANSNKPINTFSIGFKDSPKNESEYAASIAKHIGSIHHEMMITTKEAQDLVDSIITSYDEPYADSSAIPTMLVSKMAKQNVTMTLSGDGGDELFLGYGMYKWANRFNSNLFSYYQKPAKFLFSKMKPKYKRISMLLDAEEKEHLKSHIFSQEQYFFSKREVNNLIQSNSKPVHLEESFHLKRDLNAMESQAFFDLKYYLPDDLLVKVDRASMKYSLETRVPLLDYRIIEFALNLPENFKLQKNTSKYILKDILYDYVPKSYFERPKWGFGIPLDNWLKTDLSYLINDYLNETIINKYNLVKYEEVSKLLNRWKLGDDFLYNRIWLLIILHKWFKETIQ
jgi:asparagine synthase (glutamine-hydrolysing)